MKIAIIFALGIVALLNSDSADGSPYGVVRSRRDTDLQVCQPGDRKKEDCNTCFCNADGSGWGCTRMECYTGIIASPSGDPLELVKRQVSRDTSSQVCQPGDRKMEDCNSCFCDVNGSGWDCTKMECYTGINTSPSRDPLERVQRRVSRDTSSQVCQPGDRKMEDCNSCFCYADGSGWACTRMECYTGITTLPSGERLLERVQRQVSRDTDLQVCQPGDQKKEDCNTCFCIADGSGWACTRRGCYDTHIVTLPSGNPSERVKREVHGLLGDPDFRCTPGTVFKLDCNWCTCTADGRSGSCTLMGCFGD